MKHAPALLFGAAALAAAVATALPAAAATTHPGHAAHSRHVAERRYNPGDGFAMTLNSGNGQTMDANGVGAQVTTSGGTGSRWDSQSATHGLKVTSSGGYCWTYHGADNGLYLQNCSAGNGNQMFTFNGSAAGVSVTCFGTGTTVGTFSNTSSRPVYVQNSAPFNTWVPNN